MATGYTLITGRLQAVLVALGLLQGNMDMYNQTAVLIGSKLNCHVYAELGSHFGLHGERVEDPTKLKDAVQAALNKVQDGTTAILNVVLSK